MRVLIISDIHANLAAFETVMDDAKGSWDYVWCLGDVVGYGPDPNECVERLRELPHLCLAGNHDWATLGRLDIRTFNPAARRLVEWTMATLKPENRAYLENLPVTYAFKDYQSTLVHASPREPVWEYILEPLVAALNFPHFETQYCFVGHTHQPVIYERVNENGDVRGIEPVYYDLIELTGRRLIINPGSVGLPGDGKPGAAYGILNLEMQTFEHRRVLFDLEAIDAWERKMEIGRYMKKLTHGW